jgi:hypothetical protein
LFLEALPAPVRIPTLASIPGSGIESSAVARNVMPQQQSPGCQAKQTADFAINCANNGSPVLGHAAFFSIELRCVTSQRYDLDGLSSSTGRTYRLVKQ